MAPLDMLCLVMKLRIVREIVSPFVVGGRGSRFRHIFWVNADQFLAIGLPRIRVANTMLTPKTKPREIARVYYKTNKCSSSAEIERSRVSLASRGWAAASRPSDHPEQPSASDGRGE